MEQFAKWFIDFFKKLLKDIGDFFVKVFNAIYELVYPNIKSYVYDFKSASAAFSTTEWVLAILALAITIALFLGIILLIIILLRKYIRFTREAKSKDELFFEIANLNTQLSILQDGNNASVALGSADSLTDSSSGSSTSSSQSRKLEKGRFVKLVRVDEKYRYSILPTKMTEANEIGLKELVERVINYSGSELGLFYDFKTVATFFAGMAASKILILEGISGTGKTSLPYVMGKFFSNPASIISVQPSWRNRSEILGYLNEFTKRFNETEFLKVIYEATYRTDVNFVVLDEMNLARVEYYFADFLSVLEMPDPDEWLIDLIPDQMPSDPIHLEDGKLKVSQNIWFIGTANKDDSTFTITDKVYDRASSISMNIKSVNTGYQPTEPVQMSFDYLDKLFKSAQKEFDINLDLINSLNILDMFISKNFEIAFGNRVMKQIRSFIPVYIACGGDQLEALDYLVSRKIIRKFETLNLPFLQAELNELGNLLDKLFGKDKFTESRKMLDSFNKIL
jgi:hypothetical protein